MFVYLSIRLLNSGILLSIAEDGVYLSKENENKCCFQRSNPPN